MTLLGMSLLIAFVGGAIGWHNVPAKDMPMKALRAALLKLYAFRFFDALLPMTVALLLAAFTNSRWRSVSMACLVISLVVSVFLSFRAQQLAPNAFSVARYEAWQDACEWLKGKHSARRCDLYTTRIVRDEVVRRARGVHLFQRLPPGRERDSRMETVAFGKFIGGRRRPMKTTSSMTLTSRRSTKRPASRG